MPNKLDYVEAARGWLDVRWLHQGRSRQGIDCVGLLIVAAADLGITLPDMPGYRRSSDPAKFLGHVVANSLPESEPHPGAFGIFRDGTQPCHVGIFGERDGHLTLIHAYAGTGKVMEELFIHDWPLHLMSVRSIEGLV